MLGVTLGCLYVDAQGYVPELPESLCGMSCFGTYWLLGGGWFQCRYEGFWMVSCLWTSVFILPVVSRLLQLYSTDNKTSRLIVKRFSTVRDTQRGSQCYMKKRRRRRELETSRWRKRGTQEERDRSTQFSVPSVFHSPDTHRDSQNWIGKRRGREEIEVI